MHDRVKERLGSAVIKKGKVVKNLRNRALQRRVRRGRRIKRKVPFNQRAHRQKRFDNRTKKGKLAPSIRASREMEIRVITELSKVFPISKIVYELVKADVDLTSGRKGARSGKGFSPVMVGQNFCVEKLKSIAPVKTVYGWQKNNNGTSQIRRYLGLKKIKDKKAQVPESHGVDGIALGASEFVRHGVTPGKKSDIWGWKGAVNITSSVFRVITRSAYFRRALHFDNVEKGGIRKRKGGKLHLSMSVMAIKLWLKKQEKSTSVRLEVLLMLKQKTLAFMTTIGSGLVSFLPKKLN